MNDSDNPIIWFWQFANKPLFTQAKVLELAGPDLTPVTLQNWANRTLVSALTGPGEHRGRRMYDALQVERICLGFQLMQTINVPPFEAMAIIAQANANALRHVSQRTVVAAEKAKSQKAHSNLSEIEKLWIVIGKNSESSYAVKLAGLPKALQKSGAALVLPYGRDLMLLATKARQIYDRDSNQDGA